MMQEDRMSPLFVSPGNRRIVVFGGGRVAQRKCAHFEGFRITVVAEEVLPELAGAVDEIVLRRVDPDSVRELCAGAWMAVAATDSQELNGIVRDTAMSMGILANSAHGGGDVLIPSVLRRDGFTVTVSTGGRVPAFPPYAVKAIDSALDGGFDLMVGLLAELRVRIRDRIPTQKERAAFLAKVLEDQSIWDRLREGDTESAMKLALDLGGIGE